MELQDLPPSMSPQAVWSNVNGGKPDADSVVLNIGTSDTSSNEEDEFDEEGRLGKTVATERRTAPHVLTLPPRACPTAGLYRRVDDDDDELEFRGHHGDWEVQMLARELERREEQSRLQEEVRVLEQAVNDNTCTLDDLTNSQLDLLERMLTSSTALRRATAPAHYPMLGAGAMAGAASHSHAAGGPGLGLLAGLGQPLHGRLRRGLSLEEADTASPLAVASTSSSALHRRRSFRQHSLLSRSNGSQGGVGAAPVPGLSSGLARSLENAMHRVGAAPTSAPATSISSPPPGSGSGPGVGPSGRPASKASPRKQQLLNARSLEEHREPLSAVLHRLTSRSTSHLTHSSFPSNLVRGLGHLVRGHAGHASNASSTGGAPNSGSSTVAAAGHHHHHHHLQIQEASAVTSSGCSTSTATPSGAGAGAAVATISQGILAPPPPPPPPPPDL